MIPLRTTNCPVAMFLGLTLATDASPRLSPTRDDWHYSGHAVVAILAHERMSPRTRQRVRDLLEAHPRYEEDFVRRQPRELRTDRAKTLWLFGEAANWADRVKRFPKGSSESKRYDRRLWHYVNYPVFLTAADEKALGKAAPTNHNRHTTWKGGKPSTELNVVQALGWASSVVGDRKAEAAERAIALCWLFHLAGDSHQPLHSASLFSTRLFPEGDRGGNDIRMLRGGTMHSFWDGLVNERPEGQSLEQQAAALSTAHAKFGIAASANLDFERWIRESFRIAQREAYSAEIREQLQEVKTKAGAGVRPSAEYVARARKIGEQRVVEAGFRLGALLERLLAPRRVVR